MVTSRSSLILSINGLNALSAWITVMVNPTELYSWGIFSRPLENSTSFCDVMWITDLYFTCISIDTRNATPLIYTISMHNSIFDLFYVQLRIWMSYFITGLGLLFVYLPLILDIDDTYIFSVLILSATDIG